MGKGITNVQLIGGRETKGASIMRKIMIRRSIVLVLLGCLSIAYGEGDSKPVSVMALRKPIRLACIGDSITEGYGAGGAACTVSNIARKGAGEAMEGCQCGCEWCDDAQEGR